LPGLPRPIFLSVGRLAVEKNLAAFLSLDLPGSKVVVGDGPDRARLQALAPEVHFLGALTGEALAKVYASADAFIFPSLTDTFGIVLLEAL
ncbi:glycosyltransferase, partial [Klebsiella pneumoniae]|nr:glycosyltransferase [Klebsiella pneumoniae]